MSSSHFGCANDAAWTGFSIIKVMDKRSQRFTMCCMSCSIWFHCLFLAGWASSFSFCFRVWPLRTTINTFNSRCALNGSNVQECLYSVEHMISFIKPRDFCWGNEVEQRFNISLKLCLRCPDKHWKRQLPANQKWACCEYLFSLELS